MSTETVDSVTVKTKSKKKSIVERELETSLTEKLTSPLLINDKSSTSRYGRARRSKTDSDFCDNSEAVIPSSKSPKPINKSLNDSSVPIYASKSPIKKETPVKAHKLSLDSHIENIFNENEMMSRFSSEKKGRSASIKSPKIYVRKDLIQRKDKEETITLIKNMFSPGQSPYKPSNSHLNNYLERSSEKYNWNKSYNGHMDMSSVVKTLDFDNNKKKKREKASKSDISKSELFEIEAKCSFQVGDLAWARVGTFPFWPCIVTRDPETGFFVKKKLFGRIERDIINVTFFNDNGRRSWVVENMLRYFKGKAEFLETREKFTPENKKKDPRLFAAFFVSDKKQHLWNLAIHEADSLLKEPKRFRIELLNEMIWKSRAEKFDSKKSGKVTRTDSDVSLSESLYDSLFSEEDVKDDSNDRSKIKSRNKSFDVSDVVTACLDNMAAKTGITKIKKQSHMDIWLQKAKSKTPEKNHCLGQIISQKSSETKTGNTKKITPQSRSRSSRISKRNSTQKFTNDTVINVDVSKSINDVDPCNIVNESVENIPLVNGNDHVLAENGETGKQFCVIAKVESISDQSLDDAVEDQSSFDNSMVNNKVDVANMASAEVHNEQDVGREKYAENVGNIDSQILKMKSIETVFDKDINNLSLSQVVDSNSKKSIKQKANDYESLTTDLLPDAADSSKKPKNLEVTLVQNFPNEDHQNEITENNTQITKTTTACDVTEVVAVEKEVIEQTNNQNTIGEENSKIVNVGDPCKSLDDKSFKETVSKDEIALCNDQINSCENMETNVNTGRVTSNRENEQKNIENILPLAVLTEGQTSSCETVCKDSNVEEIIKQKANDSESHTTELILDAADSPKEHKNLGDTLVLNFTIEDHQNELTENNTKITKKTTREVSDSTTKIYLQNCEVAAVEKEVIEQTNNLNTNDKENSQKVNVGNEVQSVKDKSLKEGVPNDENAFCNNRNNSCENMEINDNNDTLTLDQGYDQNNIEKVLPLTMSTEVENGDQTTSCETICEDVEMQDNTEINNDKLNIIEESGQKDKTMNDLVNEIDSKKKTKDLQVMILNASITENIVTQVKGTRESDSDSSKNHKDIEISLEKTSLKNKDCEPSSQIKIRKRFSLRRNNKDKLNNLNEKSCSTKSSIEEFTCKNFQITIEKSKEIDWYIKQSKSSINIDKLNSLDQRSNKVVPDKEACKLSDRNTISVYHSSGNNNDLSCNSDLKFNKNSKEALTFENSIDVTNLAKSTNSAVCMNGDVHMTDNDIDSCESKPTSHGKKSKKVLNNHHSENDLDSFINRPSSSKIKSERDKPKSTKNYFDSCKNNPNPPKTRSKKVLHNESSEKDLVRSKNNTSSSVIMSEDEQMNKSIKHDVDYCKNNLNSQKTRSNKVLHNESSAFDLDPSQKNTSPSLLTSKKDLQKESIMNDVEFSKNNLNLPKTRSKKVLHNESSEKDLSTNNTSSSTIKIEDDLQKEPIKNDEHNCKNYLDSPKTRSNKVLHNESSEFDLDPSQKNTSPSLLTSKKDLQKESIMNDVEFSKNNLNLPKTRSKKVLHNESSEKDLSTNNTSSSTIKIEDDLQKEPIKNDEHNCKNYLDSPKTRSNKVLHNESSEFDLDPSKNNTSPSLLTSKKDLQKESIMNDVEFSKNNLNLPKTRSKKVLHNESSEKDLSKNITSSSTIIIEDDLQKEPIKNDEHNCKNYLDSPKTRSQKVLHNKSSEDDLNCSENITSSSMITSEKYQQKETKNVTDFCKNKRSLPKTKSKKVFYNESSENDLDACTNPSSSSIICQKDIHYESSMNDVGLCKNEPNSSKISSKNDQGSCNDKPNSPKISPEKENHESSTTDSNSLTIASEQDVRSVNDSDSKNAEQVESAKTDSVKLNIADVEVCISDGNISRVTSPLENTKKSDVCFKENISDRLDDFDSESLNSENSEIPLSMLTRKKVEDDLDLLSSNSSSPSRRSSKRNKKKLNFESTDSTTGALDNPEFVKYMEMRQDQILDENPELTKSDLIKYLYKTWLYQEESKSDRQKTDDLESSNIVKGLQKDEPIVKPKRRVNKLYNNVRLESMSVSSDENEGISKRSLRSRTNSPLDTSRTSSPCEFPSKEKVAKVVLAKLTEDIMPEINKIYNDADKDIGMQINKSIEIQTPTAMEKDIDIQINKDIDPEVASIDSENSDVPLIQHKIHLDKLKASQQNEKEVVKIEAESKVDDNSDALSLKSEDSTTSFKKGSKPAKELTKALDDPEFVKYLEFRQDDLMDEHPGLTYDEIVQYLHKTWLYEESCKSETKKIDEIEQLNLVKGHKEPFPQPKKIKKKIKDKELMETDDISSKDKPKRKVAPACYNEEYFDLDVEDDIKYFEIFKKKPKTATCSEPIKKDIKTEDALHSSEIMSPESEKEPIPADINSKEIIPTSPQVQTAQTFDKAEIYFQNLTKPKPNVFKGMAREKVCEICRKPTLLVKCRGCFEMFHVECVKKETEMLDTPVSSKGRKKKKKPRRGRKPKSANDSIESSSHSDEKYQGLNNSEDYLNMSIEESEPLVADAESFEAQVAAKMKELMDAQSNPYTPSTSNIQIGWATSNTGKCEIVDVKVVDNIDYSDFKCNNCQKCDTPLCFVCKSPVSPKSGIEIRQKCQQTHCQKYYHLECLDHWPQTQFNSAEMLKNKKSSEAYEAVTCPRHVCHTCVSDDPRGCKTRFSADKLARCVRCPATYHTFTKCLPAGTQILTGSHIICPRHYEHRPGKVPCHVNTGWCFICALGGILICCEYCPTSFHADCLKISPPEGGYMCEDCETGRLPLYGEMVWVKLGHYRWWPGLILHPSEVPLNIMAVKHSPGEFVVRFFGQYDHYWVNRGRVFPFQEGDSGRISSQKSKIDAAFTMAMEHAQRACQILKNANPNSVESSDIASSLLPPAYVKLKVNKPCGSLVGRRVELTESSLTQCECAPLEPEPCGPSGACLNRMLLTECGPTCRAGDRCQNRAFERREYPKLTPYRTPHRGWGLKTLEDIKMGQFVIEYVGELIDEEEFRRRMARMHDVRDENFYFLTLDKERMIDAGPKGNLARFMNHCCEPNCETQKWTVLGDVRVGLFALRDIPAGSEVTFNYNFECAGIEKKRCLCGARLCSGYIGAKPKQEEYQPKKPRIPGVKRVYRKRKQEESPTITKTKVPKPRTTSRSKPKELTEIEKDLLIIKSATNGLSSDSEASGRLNSFDLESDKNQKVLKRKRVSFSAESEVILLNSDAKPPSVKRCKVESDKVNDVGD